MNSREKFFFVIGTLVIILGAFLRIGHFVEVGTGAAMIVLGNIGLVLAYSRYSRRLIARVSKLEKEVQQLRSTH